MSFTSNRLLRSSEIWMQHGQILTGEASSDQFGTSVAVNSAGDRIVVGAPFNDGGGTDSGSVRVYSYSGGSWSQLGQDIDGAAGNQTGVSVAMNSVGDRIVVGSLTTAVKVYSYNGSSWVQLGVGIEQGTGYIDMNSTGDRIAINLGLGGAVGVYSYNGSAWALVGNSSINYNSAESISLNSAGDRIVIGAPLANDGDGLVGVFSYNGSSWSQLGSDINPGDIYVGSAVSINSTGNIISFRRNGNYDGAIETYSYNGSSWVQLGQTILGQRNLGAYSWGNLTNKYAMSKQGDRIVVGYNGSSGNTPPPVYSTIVTPKSIVIYQYTNSSWIVEDRILNNSGTSFSTNNTGSKIVWGNPSDSSNRGAVKTYFNSKF
jgi:hypothetical protein